MKNTYIIYCWLLFVLLALSACGPRLVTIEVQNEDGIITGRYSENPETQLREGKSFLYYENGKVLEEADYKSGVLEGQRKLYYENGNIQAIENYQNGTYTGLFQAYYEDGALELEGHYTNGAMNGEWKRYYDAGVLMEVVLFKENEENGAFIEYYENGKLKAEGTYKDGDNEHGELKLYNELGDLIRTMDCDMGRCHTVWQKTEKEI